MIKISDLKIKELTEEKDRSWCDKFEMDLFEYLKINNLEINKNNIITFIKEKGYIKNDFTRKTVEFYTYLINHVILRNNIDIYIHIFDIYDNFKQFRTDGYTFEEFKESLDMFINAQDEMIAILAFEGLSLEEISDLKVEDIDFENRIIHTKKRDLKFNEFVEKSIKETIKEDSYACYTEKLLYFQLNPNSKYLIKPVARVYNNNGLDPYKVSSITQRLTTFRKLFQDKRISVRIYNISGYAYRYRLYLEENDIENSLNSIKSFVSNNDINNISINTLKKYYENLYKK